MAQTINADVNITGRAKIDSNVAVGGSMNINGSAAVGNDMEVNGSLEVLHDVKIDGWLDAPNIKGYNKGLFTSYDALKGAYPNPEIGWVAFVLTAAGSNTFAVYGVVDKTQGWTSNMGSGGRITITAESNEHINSALFSPQNGRVKLVINRSGSIEGQSDQLIADVPMAKDEAAAGGLLSNADYNRINAVVTAFEAVFSKPQYTVGENAVKVQSTANYDVYETNAGITGGMVATNNGAVQNIWLETSDNGVDIVFMRDYGMQEDGRKAYGKEHRSLPKVSENSAPVGVLSKAEYKEFKGYGARLAKLEQIDSTSTIKTVDAVVKDQAQVTAIAAALSDGESKTVLNASTGQLLTLDNVDGNTETTLHNGGNAIVGQLLATEGEIYKMVDISETPLITKPRLVKYGGDATENTADIETLKDKVDSLETNDAIKGETLLAFHGEINALKEWRLSHLAGVNVPRKNHAEIDEELANLRGELSSMGRNVNLINIAIGQYQNDLNDLHELFSTGFFDELAESIEALQNRVAALEMAIGH